jgi:hypothetical protein
MAEQGSLYTRISIVKILTTTPPFFDKISIAGF